MDKDSMDASIGLQFSLELLKKYRKDGLLQAFVSRVPGVSGKCHVEVAIMQGDVISCRAKNQGGNIYNLDINLLLKLDEIRGPFEWQLIPLTPEETRAASTTQPLSPSLWDGESGSNIRPVVGRTTRSLSPSLLERESSGIVGRTTQPLEPSLLELFEHNILQRNKSSNSPIPHVTARLTFNQTSALTPAQKHALITIYSLVDGNRSIEDIKQAVAFPPQLVEEAMQVLVWIGVIAIPSYPTPNTYP